VTDPKFEEPSRQARPDPIHADGAVALGLLPAGHFRIRVFAAADRREGHTDTRSPRPPSNSRRARATSKLPFPPLAALQVTVAAGTKDTFTLTPFPRSTQRNRATRQATPDARVA